MIPVLTCVFAAPLLAVEIYLCWRLGPKIADALELVAERLLEAERQKERRA